MSGSFQGFNVIVADQFDVIAVAIASAFTSSFRIGVVRDFPDSRVSLVRFESDGARSELGFSVSNVRLTLHLR